MKGNRREKTDPITLAVISSGLIAIAEEMGEALVRSAFSPNIKERRDCSTAVFDSQGRLIAQAEHIPLHLGSLLGVVEAVLKHFPPDTLRSGDAFVANDPYLGGGTHLPDVTVVSPFFCKSELAGFTANVAHHADIGAKAPGGISGDARSIDEEGLRLPPTRLATAKGICQEVLDLFLSRCRMPEQRRLDLTGQLAANQVGLQRLQEVFDKYGAERLSEATDALLNATEVRARAAIKGVPDGFYEAEDQMEGLEGEEMIPIRVGLEVRGDRLRLDFSGSGPPSRGAINVPRNALLATIYYAVKASLDPGLPSNAGLHRAIEVSVPENSILNAQPPAAVGARTDTCQHVAGRIIEAFAQALPGRLPAPANDASTAVVFSGVDPRSGREYVYVEAIAGGAGGGPDEDGLDGVQVHITNTSNLPAEALEHAFPLLVERYELVPDSGGPGEFRGGLGLRRDIRVIDHEAIFSAHGDRHKKPARGAAGGLPGACGAYVVNPGSSAEQSLPPKVSDVHLAPGAVLRVQTPGGGGFGKPEKRKPARITEDLQSGLVSPNAAAEIYKTSADEEGSQT
ncbi:MAG: hydantoinase B/oxoprolinase family protein [Armatimonadetes bacterium]|nr:hydantoinase B/oxoprolinase family protein [Armatimonadota bacterium]NIM24560.1 hydantoinase B/oxoprolinase family protein [Armatimonadota bacterium]NIM68436.1 hydantoinase B/oxoprolinase family protein [Armatimonadota bacterium]NIM76822.1 hydantoinase B/oxoprolinase family protein [Armatimonadota bacterium]NIN06633.1 hydantoinase B/oxoprolinase family protein [Armatimonadota bacterium]